MKHPAQVESSRPGLGIAFVVYANGHGGEPNNAIARQSGLTEGTVKIHIAAILRGLQSRNRTELR